MKKIYALIVLMTALTISQRALAEEKRLAYSKKDQVEVFAEETQGQWCGEDIRLRLVADNPGALVSGDVENLIRKLGYVIGKDCKQGRHVSFRVEDRAQKNLFEGKASQAQSWQTVFRAKAEEAPPLDLDQVAVENETPIPVASNETAAPQENIPLAPLAKKKELAVSQPEVVQTSPIPEKKSAEPPQASQKQAKASGPFLIEEQIVGPAPEVGAIYWLSPKGMRLAAVHMKGSRFVVSIDGVAGPKFDEILKTAVGFEDEYDKDGTRRVHKKWEGPVAFSPDGSRYAYAARKGKEVVVILDGKEIFRGPYHESIPPLVLPTVSNLTFSPDGKHLFFFAHTWHLMMDGQAVTPKLAETPRPFFSADGSRWGLLSREYTAITTKSIDRHVHRQFLMIDGKEVGYTCENPRFTPDGKHVVCTQRVEGKIAVLVDGMSIMTANHIDKLTFSPSGDIGVIASDKAGKKRLYINGEAVPGAEDAWSVTFSPDGKRWAAVCRSHPMVWVVVDGKKEMEYDNVRDVAFTPDSSKYVYVAKVGKKEFVVTNGEEDAGAQSVRRNSLMFGKTGDHVLYAVNDRNEMKVYHDGKAALKSRQVSELTISPDGARHSYYNATSAMSGQLIVNGEVVGGGTAYSDKIIFSPDSQHIAAMSKPLPRGKRALYLDGRFVSLPGDMRYIRLLGFTPDSQHLLIRRNENTKNGPVDAYYLDGQRVAAFALYGIRSGLTKGNKKVPMLSKFWEVQPDGGILLIGHERIENNEYGVVKRVKVTPASGTSYATWVTKGKAP